MFYKKKHLISIGDVRRKDFIRVFEETTRLETYLQDPEKRRVLKHILHAHPSTDIAGCEPKMFYRFISESSRTDITFEAAVRNLGGISSWKPIEFSSVSKGESADILACLMGNLCTGVFVRHDTDGFFAKKMADAIKKRKLSVSVINAGCGSREHPTQTFIDLYPLYRLRQRDFLAGKLTYALGGDLSCSRTIHSLLIGLATISKIDKVDRFLGRSGVKIYLFGPEDEKLPAWLIHKLRKTNLELIRVTNTLAIAPEVDVWYFTRWQKNLRKSGLKTSNIHEEEYVQRFGVTKEFCKRMHKGALALHPLPTGKEYPEDIDIKDDRFIHIQQMNWGVPIRMAILRLLFAPDHEMIRIQKECFQDVLKYRPENLIKIEIPVSDVLAKCSTCQKTIIAGYGRSVLLVPGEEKKLKRKPANSFCESCRNHLYLAALAETGKK